MKTICSVSLPIIFVPLQIASTQRRSLLFLCRLLQHEDDQLCCVADVFDVGTISQLSETISLRSGRLFSSLRQYFWNQDAFFRSGNDHLRSETDFSITEKISGASPTIFFATKQIILRENYNDSNGIRIAIMRQSAEQLVATAGFTNNPVFPAPIVDRPCRLPPMNSMRLWLHGLAEERQQRWTPISLLRKLPYWLILSLI